MEPEPNQHPRFKWKPDDSLSSESLPPRRERQGEIDPDTSNSQICLSKKEKAKPIRLRRESFAVSEINCDDLTLDQIASILKLAGFSAPMELLEHIASVFRAGGPLNLKTLSEIGCLIENLEISQWVGTEIGDHAFTTEWEYRIKKYEEDDESDVLTKTSSEKRNLCLRFSRGRSRESPRIAIDWSGLMFDGKNPVFSRWKLAHEVCGEVVPELQVERIGNLSEFVKGEVTGEGDPDIALTFGRAGLVVNEMLNCALAGKKSKPLDEEDAQADPDFMSSLEHCGNLDYGSLDDLRNEQKEEVPAKPEINEPVIVQHVSAKSLARLSRLAGLELEVRFFSHLMDLMERGEEPGEGTYQSFYRFGRGILFEKSTYYDTDTESRPAKWSDINIEDLFGPYGGVHINLKHVWDQKLNQKVIKASFEFKGSPDEKKKLRWKKILKAAGY